MSTILGSNNAFPSVLLTEGTTPTTPASGKQRLFVRSSDGHLCTVDDAGTVTDIQGGSSTVITGAVYLGTVDGRLTTESGVPVSTADRSSQSTIYFTPYGGNQIALYSGSAWVTVTFSELSLALSGLTSGKNYDVFVDYNSGMPQLVLSSAWTNDTTRADAIALLNGVYVKSGTSTYRYVGTIRTTGTTTTEDSAAKRFIWNLYNRTRRHMQNVTETTDSWNYTTATFRQANANTANQLDYVVGLSLDVIEAVVRGGGSNSTGGTHITLGVGVDSTSANSAQVFGQPSTTAGVFFDARYLGFPGIGRHYLAWLEYSQAQGTTTWYGDAGQPTRFQSGITGTLMN